MTEPSDRDREMAREMYKQYMRPQGWDDESLIRCYSQFLADAREEGRAEEREAREDAERGFLAIEQECREANRRLREATQWRPIDDGARNGQRWLLKTRWWGAREGHYVGDGLWAEERDIPLTQKQPAIILDEHVTAYAPLPEMADV